MAKALLKKKGYDAKTHEGIIKLFSLKYVNEDTFNYEIGCRIALAKAERIAYKRVGKGIAEEYKSLANFISDLDNFIYKAESMVKHNTEYIKKLSNCSEKE